MLESEEYDDDFLMFLYYNNHSCLIVHKVPSKYYIIFVPNYSAL